MPHSDLRRFLVAVLLLGAVCILPACESMGGNGDDGDDEKFPEPPNRPSSAFIVPAAVVPAPQPAVEGPDDRALAIQDPRPTS